MKPEAACTKLLVDLRLRFELRDGPRGALEALRDRGNPRSHRKDDHPGTKRRLRRRGRSLGWCRIRSSSSASAGGLPSPMRPLLAADLGRRLRESRAGHGTPSLAAPKWSGQSSPSPSCRNGSSGKSDPSTSSAVDGRDRAADEGGTEAVLEVDTPRQRPVAGVARVDMADLQADGDAPTMQ